MKRSVVSLVILILACAGLPIAAPAAAPASGSPAADLGPEVVAGELVLQLTPTAVASAAFRPELAPAGRTGLSGLDAVLASVDAVRLEPVFGVIADAAAHREAGLDRIYLVRLGSAIDPTWALRRLNERSEVAFAEPNGIARAMLTPNDTYYASQWAHHNTGQAVKYGGGLVGTPDCDTDTDEAWDLETGSSSLVLAIIDTGVDTGHPEFAGRIVAGYDFVNNDTNPMDDAGHGTCCAGIAVGAGNNAQGIAGVAWGVKLMPVKVLNSSGSGTYTAIANGITWAADQGAKVLSMSLGGSVGSTTLESAVNYAYNKGCAIFAASGNGNASSLSYPARYANCIAIGALSPCNERKSTSTCDGETWWGSNYGTGLAFLAPGVRIHTADIRGSGGYGSGDYITDFNGTSSATPHAAGIGALVWSENSTLTNAQLRSTLNSTCDDLGTAGYDVQTGYGRLNAYAAVVAAGGGTPPPPPPEPVVIFTETFESTTVPGSIWSATDANATNGLDYWGDQSSSTGARVHGGSWSAYCADNSSVSGQKYDHYMSADMSQINALDLSSYTGVTLSFWIWLKTANASDYLEFQYWNGSSWVAQQRWTTTSNAWINPTYAVTGSSLKFRFYFYSNNSRNAEGAYVDDIRVTGTPVSSISGGPVMVTLLETGEESERADKAVESAVSGELTTFSVAPNPMRGATTLRLALAGESLVRVELFNVDGRRVARIHDGTLPAGEHQFGWSGVDARGEKLAAGVYYARLSLDGEALATRPVLIVR